MDFPTGRVSDLYKPMKILYITNSNTQKTKMTDSMTKKRSTISSLQITN